jgi:DNA-directed RNA polymerase
MPHQDLTAKKLPRTSLPPRDLQMLQDTQAQVDFEVDEPTRTHNRFTRIQQRSEKNFGTGATAGALALSEHALPRLTAAVITAFEEWKRDGNTVPLQGRLRFLSRIEPEQVALSILTHIFHAIGGAKNITLTCIEIGTALRDALWHAGLIKQDRRVADKIEKRVTKKHGRITHRRKAARVLARKAGYKHRTPWSRPDMAHVGEWGWNIAAAALPDLLAIETDAEGVRRPTITEDALEVVEQACEQLMRRMPVFLPSVTPAVPWNGWSSGGVTEPRMQRSAQVVRSPHGSTKRLIGSAIASGQMQPALDALNRIQATGWRINTDVLAVMRECVARGIHVEGLPLQERLKPPPKPKPWEEMTEEEQDLWKHKASEIKLANRIMVGGRISFAEDMSIASYLAEHRAFWLPCNLDWRGRVYSMPHFSFQREDRVRALFLFSEGVPITERGIWWLKVHVANCGAFDKVDKRSFEERVAWVDEHVELIKQTATDPLAPSTLKWWTQAEQPWLFLAACMELSSALLTGESFVSALPVSWDGSCSGLQHLCAMTRAPEGSYVNLTNSNVPQDVYQRVADACAIRVMEDAAEGNELAQKCLDYGITRSLVKRNVMTYSYSSKRYGMTHQLIDDVMEPLRLEVVTGFRLEHPFGKDAHEHELAARYLSGHIYGAIEEVVNLPAKAMHFLQTLSRAAAKQGKVLNWVTPVGLSWCNRYHEPDLRRVHLYLYDKGVKLRYATHIAVGFSREINKRRVTNAVSPNFVHACDASHLMMVVNAAHVEGIKHYALVHDSFGCHAAHAERYHQIIREQFVRLYTEHDVLAEVLKQAREDLPGAELPEAPPDYGNLNIEEVLNARYAFA